MTSKSLIKHNNQRELFLRPHAEYEILSQHQDSLKPSESVVAFRAFTTDPSHSKLKRK